MADIVERLEPCPFCGGKAIQRDYDDRYPYEVFGLVVGHAEDCFLALHLHSDEIWKRWNTRADSTTIEALCAENERMREVIRDIAAEAYVSVSKLPDYDQPNGWRDVATERIDIARRYLAAMQKEVI